MRFLLFAAVLPYGKSFSAFSGSVQQMGVYFTP